MKGYKEHRWQQILGDQRTSFADPYQYDSYCVRCGTRKRDYFCWSELERKSYWLATLYKPSYVPIQRGKPKCVFEIPLGSELSL